jgi:hypothetical protein
LVLSLQESRSSLALWHHIDPCGAGFLC